MPFAVAGESIWNILVPMRPIINIHGGNQKAARAHTDASSYLIVKKCFLA